MVLSLYFYAWLSQSQMTKPPQNSSLNTMLVSGSSNPEDHPLPAVRNRIGPQIITSHQSFKKKKALAIRNKVSPA